MSEVFAMGQQERLGAGSRLRWLDPGVVRIVLIRSFPLSHHSSLGSRERRCGFDTKHQSTMLE